MALACRGAELYVCLLRGAVRAARRQAAFLEELERTMALLAFEDTSTSPVGCEPLSATPTHPVVQYVHVWSVGACVGM